MFSINSTNTAFILSVGPSTVQIRHFILRSPGAMWTLSLGSKIGCIIIISILQLNK